MIYKLKLEIKVTQFINVINYVLVFILNISAFKIQMNVIVVMLMVNMEKLILNNAIMDVLMKEKEFVVDMKEIQYLESIISILTII